MSKLTFLFVCVALLVPMTPARAQQSMYDYIINQAVGPQNNGVSQYDASQVPTLDVDQMYPRQPEPAPYSGDVQVVVPPSYSQQPYCTDGSIPIYEYCADGSMALYR